MNKKKSTFLIAFMVLCLSLGSVQAYAASNNSNIFIMVKQVFDNVKDRLINTTNSDMDRVNNSYKESLQADLANVDKAIGELDQIKQNHVTSGEAQVREYTEAAKAEIKDGINQGKTNAENEIKNKVNTKVTEGKAAIDAEINRYLKGK
ncbi:MAG: hypothetical protein K0S41_1239 [Anaerocolumna sp.]|jgi:uncharacterized protein YycO|nr:hypothetical protein [Anaerocolumna sp.]